MQNDFIAGITIVDSRDKICVAEKKMDAVPLVKRSVKLTYFGEPMGGVEISLTSGYFNIWKRQLFWYFCFIILINLLSLILLTGLFLRRSLNKPLRQLDELVASYNAGHSKFPKQEMPYVELRSFVETLQRMGKQIDDQMSAIQQAERKYRSIFENALEGIYQSTPEGRIISANPAFAAILGYDSPDQLIQQVTDIGEQHYVDEQQRQSFIRQLERAKVIEEFEVQLHRKDGQIIWTSINARPIFGHGGRLLHFEGLVQDITRKKTTEMQLRQAQKMEAIGTLAGGIAHDFNNILGVIIGCSELALNNLTEGHSSKADIEKVLDAGLNAKALVRQILTFSRQGESEYLPLILQPFLKEVTKFLRATLPSTVDIRLCIETSNAVVLADPIQIQQILMNLCTNSAQAMSARGGELQISLKDIDVGPEEISQHEGLKVGKYVKLSVRDTGCGISKEALHRIFDPFFTTKNVGEGTGLGLSVVHGIVQKHGGVVVVDSVRNERTIFDVFLPKLEHPDIQISQEQISDLPKGAEHILLVDDEEILADILQRILNGLGYTVDTYTSSIKALEMFSKNPDNYDLVISDHMMPDITGVRLAKKVRQFRPHLPIILCTGLKDENIEEEAKMADVSRMLVKPIRRDELALIIREVLDG
jgi:PAS domain S-box-containing protein